MNIRHLLLGVALVPFVGAGAAQAPQTTLQMVRSYGGHKGPVETLTFSPDSTRLFVMASQTGYVVDVKTKQVLLTIPMGVYGARATWVSERSLRVETGGRVLYFDPTTGKRTSGQQFNSRGDQTIVSPSGVAAVRDDEVIALHDVSSGSKIRSIDIGEKYLDSFDVSPDGRRLAVADYSLGARLYNADNGNLIRQLVLKADWTRAVTFSPDGRQVIVAVGSDEDDASLQVFDAGTGDPLNSVEPLPDSVDTFAWGPDGLLAAADFGDAYVFDTQQGSLKYSFAGFSRSPLALAVSPDGETLAYGSWFGDLRFATLSTGRVTQSLGGFPGSSTWCLKLSPNGKQVLTCGYDHTARLYDLATGKTVASLSGHPHWVSEGLFIPGGGIATLSDTTIFIWSGQGQRLKVWEHRQDEVEGLTVHPSGKYLAYSARDYGEDNDFIVREVATGKIVARLPQGEALPAAAAFAPNGKTLMVLDSEGRLVAWNWSQGVATTRTNLGDDYRNKLIFDPQGRYLALEASEGGVMLLDALTLKRVRQFPMPQTQDFAFSSSGEKLIVKGDQKITVFNVRSGQALQSYGSPVDGSFVVPSDGRSLLLNGDPTGGASNATLYRAPQGTPFK